jgi:hypothetical protein
MESNLVEAVVEVGMADCREEAGWAGLIKVSHRAQDMVVILNGLSHATEWRGN